MLGTLRDLYMRIPKKWRKAIINWVFPFLFGLLITWIWDVATLLVILFLMFIIFYLFYIFGNEKARVGGRWSITEYYKRIRGIILFALLPTVCELIREFSIESIVALLVIIIVAFSIWEKFNKVIENTNRQFFKKRKGRRR